MPFSEPHPYHSQVMHVERIPFPLPGLEEVDAPAGLATMGWGFRKWPRAEDGVEFSDERTDAFGMPAPTIRYELTDRELARARNRQDVTGKLERFGLGALRSRHVEKHCPARS